MKAQILLIPTFFIVCSTALSAQTATAPSGSGTSEDPYLIGSLENLYWISQNTSEWDAYYQQTADIDASSTSDWVPDEGGWLFGSGTGFEPIGNLFISFTGSFDGQNFVISGIYINGSGTAIGLFGWIAGSGTLTGLHLKDVNITGTTNTGGLVGYNYQGTVSNSIVTGEVYGSESFVGGLIGNNLGSVQNSSFTGTVDGNTNIGGLVGRNEGSVTHSYVTGEVTCEEFSVGGLIGLNEDSGTFFYNYANATVSGPAAVGGLVGIHEGDSSAINYAIGDVTGEELVGGLIGRNLSPIANSYATGNVSDSDRTGGVAGENQSTITNSYAAGTVTGTTNTGGFVGDNETGTITSGFWDTGSGSTDNGFGTGLSNSEMKQEASFTGFDFTDIWQIHEGYSYPFLRDILPSAKPGAATPSITGRSVSFGGASTDYVEVPHSDDFDDLSEITIEAWVYLNSITTQGFFNKFSSSTGWYTQYHDGSSAIITSIYTGSEVVRTGYTFSIPSANKWHHLATTWDGTDVHIFLDGKNVTSGQQSLGSGDITDNTNSIRIGDHGTNLDGKMDEVRIWNVALTEDEIQQNMFQKLSGDEEGLLLYLPFDEENGTHSLDESPNHHIASLNGGAAWDSDTHPYGTFIAGDEGWRMMTVPVSGVSYGEILDTLWTQGFTGSDSPDNGNPNVYTWDEAAGWTALDNASAEPDPGTGFLVYVYDDVDYDEIPDGFPKIIQTDSTQQAGSISPTLSYTDTDNPEDDGWNLIGNPYGATIDWDASIGWDTFAIDASFYVWSDSADGGNGDYLSWNGSTGTFGGGEIAPWQGFWIKANAENPTLSLTDEVRSAGGILRKKAPVSQLGFMLKGETLSSKTILMFSENALIEKDGLDAYKLQSLNPEYLSLYTTLENGTALDINAIPSDFGGILKIPLGFEGSTLSGEFELAWNSTALPEGLKAIITDHNTGEVIPLEGHDSYRFNPGSQAKAVVFKKEGNIMPRHGVLSSPTVTKAKKGEVSRFTLTLSYREIVTSEPGEDLPETFAMDQNYPNPFNPSTVISYQLPVASEVSLKIFDVLGREVATLLDGRIEAGHHQVQFNARNLASGVYIYQLRTGNNVFTKKFTLIK